MNKTIQVINHFRSDDHKGGLAVMLKHTSGDSFVWVTTAHCSYDDAYNKKVAVQKLNENFEAGAKIKIPLVPGMRDDASATAELDVRTIRLLRGMKAIFGLVALLATSAIAQDVGTIKIEIPCGKPEIIMQTLKEYRELPNAFGKSNQYKSDVSVWVSPSGTYSIIVKDQKTGILCVLDHGENFKLYNGKSV